MKYKHKKITLNNKLSFWKQFEGKERFLFYNPIDKEFIMGAERVNSFRFGDIPKDYLYSFSSMIFFETIRDDKWDDFGNETISFEYLFVEKDNTQTLFYLNDYIKLKDEIIQTHKHKYEIRSNNYNEWEKSFSPIYNSIKSKKVDKVVLSREIQIECEGNVNIESIINNLFKNNPNSFIFAYYKNGKTFLGATPEVLIEKKKNKILSYALAGTILRDKKNDELQKQKLINDKKNLNEHKIVVNSIVNDIKKHTDDIKVENHNILTLNNLHHLYTPIYAKDNKNTIFQWVKHLHPTPALGGTPKNKALELIDKFETHERGLYGSPIGVVDNNGDGIFVVGIRSALIEENNIYAYAGCGIVEDSDCESEYIETKNKFKTIIESL